MQTRAYRYFQSYGDECVTWTRGTRRRGAGVLKRQIKNQEQEGACTHARDDLALGCWPCHGSTSARRGVRLVEAVNDAHNGWQSRKHFTRNGQKWA